MSVKTERLLKCLRKDMKDELIKAIDESNVSEEKKEELKAQIDDIKSCRGKPIDLEDVESVSSLSDLDFDKTVSILVQDNCPTCKILKERLRENVNVKFVDFDSDEGKSVSEELNLATVPSAFMEKDGSRVKCDLFNDDDSVIATCDGDTIPLD